MNTANLQLEGVYIVMSALLDAMCKKGLFNPEEIEKLLDETEKRLSQDSLRSTDIRDANLDAICFPSRFLRQALKATSEGKDHSFMDLAARVGQAKREP